MSQLIELVQQDTVAVLTMNTVENRHNPEFFDQFNQCLDTIEANEGVKSVVLTSSSDKSWSLGIDLEWMAQPSNSPQDIADFMYQVTGLLKRIVTFPMPVIAELNGHAYGNGAVLACACDFRFMKADKGFFCFPEVDVLVPFFPSMLPLISKSIPQTFFNRLAMTGQRVNAEQLLEQKVIEASFPDGDSLHSGVMEFAASFNKNRWIYGKNKTQMNKGILTAMQVEDDEFIAITSKQLWQNMQKSK
jgi:enoyl-CoA hydratase/carnithine racemase